MNATEQAAELALDSVEAIGLAEAAKLMRGRGGKAPFIDTVRRWANPAKGYLPQGPGGPRLVLMTVRVNGEVLTCERWVRAFEAARVRLGARVPPAPLARPAGRRAKADARASAELAEILPPPRRKPAPPAG